MALGDIKASYSSSFYVNAFDYFKDGSKIVMNDNEDAVIMTGEYSPRNLSRTHGIGSNYNIYSRARLPDWDFDATELQQIDRASHYMNLDRGGYEVLETLGKLHDNGEQPFSETPQSRWK